MADVSDEPIDYKSNDPIMRLRVIHENLMEHELSGTAGNLWKVITELQARRAAEAKAVEVDQPDYLRFGEPDMFPPAQK